MEEQFVVLKEEDFKRVGKIALAKVVIKTRQHLAAVKAQEKGLMLELMHFPEELIDVSEFKAPEAKSVAKQELRMAVQFIDSLTSEWEPEKYTDEYRAELEELVQDKIEHGDKAMPAPRRKTAASNIIDLASVLRQSLQETKGRAKSGSTKTRGSRKKARSAARSRKKVA